MKIPLIALAIAGLTAGAYANDADTAGTALVPNNHGGYNVVQPGSHPISLPFFGAHGYAAHVMAESRTAEKPKFILVPGVQDAGHGNPHVVYHKKFFATAEEAEAARLKQ
jgi:hypothetical protein